MPATSQTVPDGTALIPELRFDVAGAEALEHAAVPTLRFTLAIATPGEIAIRSILLDVQVQIAARRRGYPPDGRDRLLELFGEPQRWSTTLRTLPWTRTTLVVPPFRTRTTANLEVTCTYDLEVTAAKYLSALDDGEVPLEFLFSGSVFYTGAAGTLQTARIPWDREVDYRMPVATWRRAMDRHFPASAWVRLSRERFERLCAYKARHAFSSWDAALDALLERPGDAP